MKPAAESPSPAVVSHEWSPTDTAWHWWGTLNDEGQGAMIVIRGSGGADSRKVNIS
jgi:hypothetical protein